MSNNNPIDKMSFKAKFPRAMFLWQSWFVIEKYAGVRGLFGKFVEFCHKMFKYLYNPFIFLNITGGH